MRMPRALRSAFLQEASRTLPCEACGLVGGTEDDLLSFIACRNAAESPTRYVISPEDVLRALRTFEEQGLLLRAIFHSHPQGEARPSATDIREALYPGVLHLILGASPDRPLRAFWIEAGDVREEPLEDVD